MTASANLPVLSDETRKAFELLRTPVWVFDIQNERMVWANASALPLWRAPSLEALTQRDFTTDMSSDTRARLASYLLRFRAGEGIREDWTFYPDGRAQTVRCYCTGIVVDDRTMMLVEGTVHEGHAFLDALLEHLAAPVLVLDGDGCIVRSNGAAAALAGSHESALKGAHAAELTLGVAWPPPDGRSMLEAAVSQDGEIRRILWTYFEAEQLEAGDSALFVLGTDVTDRRELEAELEATARLAAIGRLADRFAHEINQPLAYLLPNLEDLLQGAPAAETQELVSESLGAAQRISSSIERIIRLASQSDDPHRGFSVAEALAEVSQLAGVECDAARPSLRGTGGRACFIHALLAVLAHYAAVGANARITLAEHDSAWFELVVEPSEPVLLGDSSSNLSIAARLSLRGGGRLQLAERGCTLITWPKHR